MSKQKKVAQSFICPLTDILEVSHAGQRPAYAKLSSQYSWAGDVKGANGVSTISIRNLLETPKEKQALKKHTGDVAAFCANFVAVEAGQRESIINLAAGIAKVGQLQPILLKSRKGGGWINLAGERRMTACALGYLLSQVSEVTLTDAFKGGIAGEDVDSGAPAPKTGEHDSRERVYGGEAAEVAAVRAKELKELFADFPATIVASEHEIEAGVNAGLIRHLSDGSNLGENPMDCGFYWLTLDSAVKSMKATSSGHKLPNFSAVAREICASLPSAKSGPMMQRVRAETTVAVLSTPEEKAQYRLGNTSWAELCSKYGVGNKKAESKPADWYYLHSAAAIGEVLNSTDNASLEALFGGDLGDFDPADVRKILSSITEGKAEHVKRVAAEEARKAEAARIKAEAAAHKSKSKGKARVTKSLRV